MSWFSYAYLLSSDSAVSPRKFRESDCQMTAASKTFFSSCRHVARVDSSFAVEESPGCFQKMPLCFITYPQITDNSDIITTFTN